MEVRRKLGAETPQSMKQQQTNKAEQQAGAKAPASAQDAALERTRAEAEEAEPLDRETIQEAVTKAIEAADAFAPRRHLEYELVTDADMVQVHVVNTKDGSVVRKIPSDDILKLVEQIHAMLADRFEVEA